MMKRTYERILFMVIGALIAFCAYLVGNMSSDISAKEDDDPDLGHVVQCDTLFVKDNILVGSAETGQIFLQVEENIATIKVKNPTIGSITLIADDDEIANKIIYGDTLNPDSYVMIGASKKGALMTANSKNVAFVRLSYNKINEILMNTSKDEAGIAIKDGNGVNFVNTE